MFISTALAAASDTAAPVATKAAAAGAPAPDGGAVLMWNVGFIAVMVFMFYLLLIRPQQVRYREHSSMIKALKKNDKIVLQSGMIAVIDKIEDGSDEVVVDLHEGNKVKVLRSAIAGRYDEIMKK